MSNAHRLVVLFCIITMHSNGATILSGNSDVADQTFSFLMDKHVQDRQGGTNGIYPVQIGNLSFFAADSSATGFCNEYALSVVARDQNNVTGIARQQATILGETIDNPLYNKGIAFLDLIEGAEGLVGDPIKPVLVTSDDLTTLYLMNRYIGHNTELAVAPRIPDATGAITSGIVGIAASSNYVFSATKPTAGGSNFGDTGSGIAVTMLGFTKTAFFGTIDAPTGMYVAGANRALPFDITSSFLRINSNLTSLGQIVDMHWDFVTNRLYIAVDAVAGPGVSDGARSIVVGYVETIYQTVDEKLVPSARILHLNPIAPDSAFDTAGDKIVGNIGSSTQIVAHKVRTMQTSTLLNYLIVQGDVGSSPATRQSVYALPLVYGNEDESLNGTIANKTADSIDFYSTQDYIFARGVTVPALAPADMSLMSDAAVAVGGGPLAAGPISDMFVRNDTVFVTVKNPNPNFTPGVFYSTALSDNGTKIKGWTTWKRATTTLNEAVIPAIDRVDGALLDPVRGDFLIQTRNDAQTATIIKRTVWGDGDAKISEPLQKILTQQLSDGIFGSFDFPYTGLGVTPGLYTISALIATSKNAVALVQTGLVVNTVLAPSVAADYATVATFNEGAITTTFPTPDTTKIVIVKGGALEDINIISAAEIASDGVNGYVVVGGTGGVAILSRADGSGWDVTEHLSNGLTGLTNDMSFKKIGNYSFVRKIINDENFLYILTDTTLDRIDMTTGNIGLGIVNAVTLATADSLEVSTLLDCLVTEKLALLGTAKGLLQSGFGANIQTASTVADVHWTLIDLPDSAVPVRELFALSIDGRAQMVGKSSFGGMVYVVSGDYGKNRARLHRLSVSQVTTGPVNPDTVQRIPDLFIKNIPSYFADFSQMVERFSTDGALFLFAKDGTQNSSVEVRAFPAQTNASPKTGFRFLGARSVVVPTTIDNGKITTSLMRDSASGSSMTTGDFGLRIQE